MSPDRATATPVADAREQSHDDTSHAEVVDEVLVEEISIDGMCGVY